MKSTFLSLLLLPLFLAPCSQGAEDHQHRKIVPGPKGGKILEIGSGHAEFFVQADKKVRVMLYDEAMKPVLPQAQEVKVIAEAKAGQAVLELEKTGEAFVSKSALPDGDGYRVVVQIKNDRAAKPQNFRIDYRPEVCGGCQRAEYACICEGHAADEAPKHSH
jgi:hypothetical protein